MLPPAPCQNGSPETSAATRQLRQDMQTAHALAVAREALIGFAATYRIVGMLALLMPMLVLANWGRGSYLPFEYDSIEKVYQLLGFVASALFIWLGIRRDWSEVTLIGQLSFLLFLFIKMVDWWWELLPKYLFFLILGLAAILALLVLGRLRRGHKGGTST